MRKLLLEKLICPNTGAAGFECFATKLQRGGQPLERVSHKDIQPDDEVVEGILISKDNLFASPIRFGVLSMLSEDDIDCKEYAEHMEAVVPGCPESIREVAQTQVLRLKNRQSSESGEWNREEMKYYDAEVATPEKRHVMCENIRNKNLPHIFLPRRKHIIDPLVSNIVGKRVIEIGCGNARTITRLMPPSVNGFHYIGTDISFWRLVVAKTVCPSGEFVQSSALNLSLAPGIADVGISFGMLHHLPNPIAGFTELHRVLRRGGEIVFQEPVKTGKIITGRFPNLESSLQTYEHSDHDGEIDLSEFLSVLEDQNYEVFRQVFLASPFRSVIETVTRKIVPQLLYSNSFYWWLLLADSIFIKTICKATRFLSPRGAIISSRHRIR